MGQIEIKDLSYSYDHENKAVDHVSFCVEKGSYTTIIGHNGSGKSTIAKLMIGLLEPESGEIIVDGLCLTLDNLAAIRNKIGIVFQNPDNQFIGATVRDDIAFGLENHCVQQEKMDEIINRFAEKVNMTKYLDSEPTHLSGGQKQRVAIAGVLAMNPQVIIFDESTSMLDPQGKDEINRVIKELHHDKKMTIISITHNIEEVAQSDHVIVLEKGKIVMEGKPEKILLETEKLIKLKLDIPFSVKMQLELAKYGIKVNQFVSMEGLVDELCRYNLKK